MNRSHYSLIIEIALLALVLLLFWLLLGRAVAIPPPPEATATSTVQSASASSAASTTRQDAASSTSANAPASTTAAAPIKAAASQSPNKVSVRAPESKPADRGATARRIENPYPTEPESFDSINVAARAAVVNIMCLPRSGGLNPISGSGTIIDPRGVILTNAHVAQYVLLSESPQVDLRCFVRTGSPALIRWTPVVLYMPGAWVEQHASEIRSPHPTGTGEHDYALLYIAGSANGEPLPASFPFIAPDTREAIGFVGDEVLAASYPAEFLGNAARNNLYSAASVTSIRQLLTFSTSSVDAISVGGVIEAQSGSSGGAIVNAWRRLVGVITTTSSGTTTADRDLRGITLGYIDRDLRQQVGTDLSSILAGDPASLTSQFTSQEAPRLIKLLVAGLSR